MNIIHYTAKELKDIFVSNALAYTCHDHDNTRKAMARFVTASTMHSCRTNACTNTQCN